MNVYFWICRNLLNPKSVYFWVFYFALMPALGVVVNQYYTIAFNGTESLSGEVYFVDKTKKNHVQRGDVIAFNPPENRFYNHSFLKVVRGVGGDVISFDERNFYVSECDIECSEPVHLGYAKPVSRNGLPLGQAEGGVIQEGTYFVWTSHKDSFDSRYEEISNIATANVIGVAYKLF